MFRVLMLGLEIALAIIIIVANVRYDPHEDDPCDYRECEYCPFPCEKHTMKGENK